MHRALRVRATLCGRSTEAEVRAILKKTVLPEGRAALGTLLTAVGRRAELTEEEFESLTRRGSGPVGRTRMILVDTEVVSEPLRGAPESCVAEWLDAQALETLYLSAITVAELRYGVRLLPSGRRRDRLLEDLEGQVLPMFAGRVLASDLAAPQAHAELMAKARCEGRAIPVTDGYIAATAAANGMMVAARDTAPFEAAGLKTLNPWTA